MLGKLLKYDLKSDIITYYIMTAVIVVMTVILGISKIFDDKLDVSNPFILMSMLSMLFAYIAIMMGTWIVTQVVIFKRFYSHNFAKEGYLTFTLPVNAKQIFLSKFISALIWTAWTGLLLIISTGTLCILMNISWNGIKDGISIFVNLFDQVGFYFVINIINYIISIPLGILVIYLAVCIGQNFTVHKVIAGVVSFFLINWIRKIIASILSGIVLIIPAIFVKDIDAYEVYMNISVVMQLLVSVALMIGSYIYCIRKMSKGLNLR